MASSTGKDVEAGFNEMPPAYSQGSGDPIMTNDSQLPSYTDTSKDMAPPPSYESLYGKIKAAQTTSSNKVELGKNVCVILLGTLGCTVMLAVTLAIPITMIVIGAIYKDDCPRERFIPIYLIVAGSFGIVKNLSSLGQRCKNKDDEDADEKNAKTNPFDGLVSCFLFAWFIAGNVWIYRTYNDFSEDPASGAYYCHPTLYYFAFWVTTATYILLGLCCCCICCGGILAACFGFARSD